MTKGGTVPILIMALRCSSLTKTQVDIATRYSIPSVSSQTNASLGSPAVDGGSASDSEAWTAAGFFGGDVCAGVAGTWGVGLGAICGIFRPIKLGCFELQR